MTWLLGSHITFDQVQGLTWFWFQSDNWLAEAWSELLNANKASPETDDMDIHNPIKQTNIPLANPGLGISV